MQRSIGFSPPGNKHLPPLLHHRLQHLLAPALKPAEGERLLTQAVLQDHVRQLCQMVGLQFLGLRQLVAHDVQRLCWETRHNSGRFLYLLTCEAQVAPRQFATAQAIVFCCGPGVGRRTLPREEETAMRLGEIAYLNWGEILIEVAQTSLRTPAAYIREIGPAPLACLGSPPGKGFSRGWPCCPAAWHSSGRPLDHRVPGTRERRETAAPRPQGRSPPGRCSHRARDWLKD